MTRSSEGTSPGNRIVTLLVAGVLLRVPFFAVQGQAGDLRLYQRWARTLATHPWTEFYALADDPDHLPGDVLVHGLLGRAWSALGGSFTGTAYFAFTRIVPFTADLLAAGLVALVVAPRRGTRSATVAAAAVLWCPAVWFDSAWWGQWDSVSAAVLLAAVVVLDRRPRAWPAGVALLAWACLVKPQLALAAGPVVVGLVLAPCAPDLRRMAGRAVAGLGTALLVVALGCLPFDVGLVPWGARWTLMQRMGYARDLYHALTKYAPNVWAFAPDTGADDAVRLGPVTAGSLGSLLVLAGLVAATYLWWRLRRRVEPLVAVLWWATANLAVFYAFATRCHERYLVPAVLLGLALAALDRRFVAPVVGFVVTTSGILLFLLLRLDGVAWEPWVLRSLALVLLASVAAHLVLAARASSADGPARPAVPEPPPAPVRTPEPVAAGR